MHCPSSRTRNVKLGIVEQSQFNRLAESANVSLRKQKFGSALPSRASLAILGQPEHRSWRAAVFEVTPINASKPEIEVKPPMPRIVDRRYRRF